MNGELRLVPGAVDVEPGAGMLAAMIAEVEAICGVSPDAPHMPPAGPAELSPPGGAFLVGIPNFNGNPIATYFGEKPLR